MSWLTSMDNYYFNENPPCLDCGAGIGACNCAADWQSLLGCFELDESWKLTQQFAGDPADANSEIPEFEGTHQPMESTIRIPSASERSNANQEASHAA